MAKEPTFSDAAESAAAVGRSGTKVLKSLALVAADKVLGTVQGALGSGQAAVRKAAKKKKRTARKSQPAKRGTAKKAKKTVRKVKGAAKRSATKARRLAKKAKRTVKRAAKKAKRAAKR